MAKEIQLTRGMVAIVDDEDYEGLAIHKWCAGETQCGFYAVRRDESTGKLVRMHCVILRVGQGRVVDHRNGNTLDNQRLNLRPATHAHDAPRGPRRRVEADGWRVGVFMVSPGCTLRANSVRVIA